MKREGFTTLQELIDACPRPIKLTIKDAAAIMDVTPQFLRCGLRQGRFPFGVGVEMEQWAYYINTERFIKYMTGQPVCYQTIHVME